MPLPSSLALPNPHWMPETRSPSTLGLLSPPKSLPTFTNVALPVFESPRAINIVLLKIATSATPFYTRHQSLLSSANRNILGMWLVAMHTTQREPIHKSTADHSTQVPFPGSDPRSPHPFFHFLPLPYVDTRRERGARLFRHWFTNCIVTV